MVSFKKMLPTKVAVLRHAHAISTNLRSRIQKGDPLSRHFQALLRENDRFIATLKNPEKQQDLKVDEKRNFLRKLSAYEKQVLLQTKSTAPTVDILLQKEVQLCNRSALSFSKDGKELGFGTLYGVNIIEPHSGRTVFETNMNKTILSSPGFNQDLNLIAFAGKDEKLYVMDRQAKCIRFEKNAGGIVYSAPRFSPDGRTLAFGNDNREFYLMDIESGNFILKEQTLSGVYFSPAVSPGGDKIASADIAGLLWILEIRSGKTLFKENLREKVYSSPAFSPDGNKVALPSTVGNTIGKFLVVSALRQEILLAKLAPVILTDLIFSPDGNQLAYGGLDKKVHVVNALTGEEIFSKPADGLVSNSFSFSPDGSTIAYGTEGKQLSIICAYTGETLFEFKTPKGVYSCPVFSPSGDKLAFGTNDQKLYVLAIH